MRHYFRTDVNGLVTGVAVTDGGFTDALDPSDELNFNPYVVAFRDAAQAEEGFSRFFRWDCECPPEAVNCPCPHMRFSNYYVENGALVEKAPITVVIDDVAQPEARFAAPLDYAPGTTVVLKLQANVPDDTTVTAAPRGRASIVQAEMELTFTDGETAPINLVAPAQGTTGRVVGIGKEIRQFSVSIRGWAS